MNIKVIGTGDMWGKYNSACYLVDGKILIDIPNGTCKNLLRLDIDLKNIDYVFLTHFHGDHYFDIPFYFLQKSFNKEDVFVSCDKLGMKKIKKIFKLAFPNTVKKVNENIKIEYTLKDNFNVLDYKVNKVLVEHGSMKPAYGYVIEKDNIKIGFTGDTNVNKNIMYMASICDYLFCDCTLINGNDKHMGIDNIEYLADIYKNCNFVVSHMGNEARKVLQKNKIKNIIVPNDGDEINIKRESN